MILLLILKISVGIFYVYLYVYYYKIGDLVSNLEEIKKIDLLQNTKILKYILFKHWTHNESLYEGLSLHNPRVVLFIKILYISWKLNMNSIWLVAVDFGIISYLSVIIFIKKINYFTKINEKLLIAIFFLMPSTLFWVSSICKEFILFVFLIPIFIVLLKINYKVKVYKYELFISLICYLFVLQLKYYYAAVLLICFVVMSCFVVLEHYQKNKLIILIISIFLMGFSTFLHPNLHADILLNIIVENYYKNLRQAEMSNSLHNCIIYLDYEANIKSFLLNLPKALLEGTFRPYPWETKNILVLIYSIENMLINLVFMLSIPFLFIYWKKNGMNQHSRLVFCVLIFVYVLQLFLTYSVANLGTLARYKVILMPLLFMVAVTSIKNHKFGRMCVHWH